MCPNYGLNSDSTQPQYFGQLSNKSFSRAMRPRLCYLHVQIYMTEVVIEDGRGNNYIIFKLKQLYLRPNKKICLFPVITCFLN